MPDLQSPQKLAFQVLVHANSKEDKFGLYSSPKPLLSTVYLPNTAVMKKNSTSQQARVNLNREIFVFHKDFHETKTTQSIISLVKAY